MNKKFNSVRYADKFVVDDANRERVRQLIDLVGTNKTVLDLGCGDGYLAKMIEKRGNTVHGIEIAEGAVKKARKKGIIVHDIDLNSDWSKQIKNRFDVVVAGEILEHVFDTDKFLTNIHKILKPGGSLVLTTPNIASFGRRIMLFLGISPLIETTARAHDAGHIRYFTKKTLSLLLLENNFKVLTIGTDTVNFDNRGLLQSTLLAKFIPTWGKTLIVKALKYSS